MLAFLLGILLSTAPAAPSGAERDPKPLSAQDAAPQADPDTRVDDVVVTGFRSLGEAVDAFVDEATEPPRGRGPARWHRRVCVGVVNLRHDAAQVLIDRVSDVAAGVGLEIGEPGCRPNIIVVASEDATGLTNALVEARPRAFRPQYAGAARSRSALDAFRETEKPVRWWHVSIPIDSDTGRIAVRMPGGSAPEIAGGGLLTSNITNRLLRTFVILDMTRLEGVTFQQLGDYVAMVSLAQIDPEANMAGFGTVLNLFSTAETSQSLTAWDRAYLQSLYDAELRQRAASAQLGEVGSIMVRDQGVAAPVPEGP